ncbi:MAG TPA: sigma-70 family RNA polymerase sigma factor [Terriglobales bacterium]|jgi:RNA polymerase sigma factor (sigma-70 family)|nr:sigma-70 family RNA polymerase sigma factor [Terriglobales bacterium]
MAQEFPVTRISVIERIRSADDAERARAISTLCEAYWRPVYKYIRLRWQRDIATAQDLTQGFFIELLERELLRRFDSGKSRLRTYLRLCVDSFVINEDKAASRQKRGGETPHLALDFAGAEDELGSSTIDPSAIASPESLDGFFEKEWIRSLFALAVDDLSKFCGERNRSQTFQLFEAYHLEGDDQISYAQLAERFGVAVSGVTNALAWARREFRRIALERLREICGSDDEFCRESKALFGEKQK